MNGPTWTEEEQRLADVLRETSHDAVPAPHGWTAIAARVEREARDDLAERRARRRHRTRGVVAAVVATGMVAATVVFALGGGLHRDPGPSAPTTPPVSTAGFDPSSPRTTWPVYRAGSDKLYADEVRATEPYDPAQAFVALFSQRSSTAGPLGLEVDGGNRVASLRWTSTALVLDLDAADTTSGTSDPRTAGLEAQAWVATAQGAFNGTDLPLVVTLHGQPFRLFGVLDTATPIRAWKDVPTTTVHRVFLPEAGGSVTSPVAIVANPGRGDFDWTVTDTTTGKAVWTEGARQSDDLGTTGFSADLPAGSYELVLHPGGGASSSSSEDLFRTAFSVTGPAPASTRTPVTNPPTTEVERVAVTWPTTNGRGLVEEWRPKGTVEQVVADLGEGPADTTTSTLRPWRGTAVASVTTRADRVVVDLSSAPTLRAPDLPTAVLWSSTLVRAVDEVLATDLPVQVTLAGRPLDLFGRIGTTTPLPEGSLVPVSQAGLFSPHEGRWGTGEAVLVGAGSADNTAVTWYVVDPVSNQTLYQGRTALDARHTYGFRLPLPAGTYQLMIHLDDGRQLTTVYDLDVL